MDNLPEDIAIRVRGVGKTYRLGVINRRTLRDEFSYGLLRLRGCDPKSKMGRVGGRELADPGLFHALDGVSFDIRKGETVGLIGRNGAGKSTILKILARITTPTTGEAWIRGRVGSMLEVGTGFHPELTGRENIYLNGTILGMTKQEIDAKFDEIVEFSEIGAFLDTPVKRYSSGMYVKLAFSIASSLDNDVLLLDEVLAVGDAAFRRKSLARMKEIADSGRTILFVSHSMGNIREICSRCIWLEDGRVRMDGPVENVIVPYAREAEAAAVSGSNISRRDDEQEIRLTRISPRFSIERHGWNIRFDWETADGRAWDEPRICAWLRANDNENIRFCAFDSGVQTFLPESLPPAGSLMLEISNEVKLIPGIYGVDCRLYREGRCVLDVSRDAVFESRSRYPPYGWRKMPLNPVFFNIKHTWKIGPGSDDPEALPPDSVVDR